MVAMQRVVILGAFAFAGALKQDPEPRALGATARKEALHSRELAFENKMTTKQIEKDARAHSKAVDSAKAAAKAMESEHTVEKRARAAEQAAAGFQANRQKQEFVDRIKAAAKIAIEKAETRVIVPGEDKMFQALTTATGISTKEHLRAFSDEFAALSNGSYIQNNVIKMHRESVAEWVIGARGAIKDFQDRNMNATNDQVIWNVGNLFNMWNLFFRKHQVESDEFRKMVVERMPKTLSTRVGPMIALMSPTTKIKFNSKELSNKTAPEACSRILSLVKDLAPEYAKIQESQALLSASAGMIPHLRSQIPQPSEHAVTLLKDVLRIGFVEALGAQTASENLVSAVAPVLAGRLHCLGVSAASAVGSLGFAALVASFLLAFDRIL